TAGYRGRGEKRHRIDDALRGCQAQHEDAQAKPCEGKVVRIALGSIDRGSLAEAASHRPGHENCGRQEVERQEPKVVVKRLCVGSLGPGAREDAAKGVAQEDLLEPKKPALSIEEEKPRSGDGGETDRRKPETRPEEKLGIVLCEGQRKQGKG